MVLFFRPPAIGFFFRLPGPGVSFFFFIETVHTSRNSTGTFSGQQGKQKKKEVSSAPFLMSSVDYVISIESSPGSVDREL